MAEISVTFQNKASESTHFWVWDDARDHDVPPPAWDGPLGPDEISPPVTLFSEDGMGGTIFYQRSGGQKTGPEDVSNGDIFSMS